MYRVTRIGWAEGIKTARVARWKQKLDAPSSLFQTVSSRFLIPDPIYFEPVKRAVFRSTTARHPYLDICSPPGLKFRFESLFSAHQDANHNCLAQQIQLVCSLFMMSAMRAQLPTSW